MMRYGPIVSRTPEPVAMRRRVPTPRLPTGPGRTPETASGHEAACPAFDTDPAAWFAWLDRAIGDGRTIESAARAAHWADPDGHVWRVVVTPDGPEVRPTFGNPFLVAHDLPIVSALLISPPLLHVELTWRHGQEVALLGADEVSVADIGLAMLTATELPHQSIARLQPDTWRRARDRWDRLALPRPRSPIS
jgi:hypothetical protein